MRFFVAVLCCALAIIVPAVGQTAGAPNIQEVLQKWRHAVQKSSQAKGTIADARTTSNEEGVSARITEIASPAGKYHAVVLRDYDTTEVALTGKQTVRRDWNGYLRTLRGKELGRLRARTFESQVSLFGPPKSAAAGNITTTDSAIIVRLIPAGGDTTTWWIDRKTWLPLQSMHSGEDSMITTTYSDWQETDGVMVPMHGKVVEPDKPEYEWNRSSVNFRDQELAADFAISTPLVNDTRIDATVPPIHFNFENGHIIFPLTVNGKDSVLFIFDTGANEEVINTSSVNEFGLEPYGKTTATGGGATADYSYARGATLSAPGIEISNQHVAVLDLGGLEQALGMKFGGILGYDFISRFVVEIDYAARLIHLHEPKIWSYSGSGYTVPVTFDLGIPFANATISVPTKNAIPAYFVLDFGAFETMTLTSPFVKANDLMNLAGTNTSVNKLTGLEHQFFAQANVRGHIDVLSLGDLKVKSIPANFSVNTTGGYASPSFSGTVGNGIYQRYHVFLDYQRDRVIFEATAETDKPYAERRTYGLTMLASGEDLHMFKITAVRPSSPAESDGFKKGDIVAGLDGKTAALFSLGELRNAFTVENAHHELKLHRGTEEVAIKVDVRLVSLDKK